MMKSLAIIVVFQLLANIQGRLLAPRRSQRSIVDIQVRHLASRSTEGPSYEVDITGENHQYTLSLDNPKTSVFSDDFKFNVAEEDENGNIIFRDDSPSVEDLQEIEDHIYSDSNSNAVVNVKRKDDGKFTLHGIVDGLSFYPNASDTYEMVNVRSSGSSGQNDYVDLHRNLTAPQFQSRATVNAQPETWVIFDYDNSQLFGQDRTKVLDYLGVFYHAINNRYATFSEPSISFRIAGVTLTSSRSAQPYMENSKTPNGTGYDINMALDAFSKWVFTNQNSGPKFDMTALIAGIDFQSKDSSGTYSSGVAGLAYLKAACYKTSDRWYATSVTEDRGGYYDGMFSVAHEFAHNLGSPHDGDGDASTCSWDNGYIMSYKGWGTKNKFYFSSCSINLMSAYISSNEGSCLRSIQSTTNIAISSQNVGDRYNMTALCVKYTSQTSAVPEPTKTAGELCKNLSCRYPTPGKPAGYYSIVTLNHPPGDNTPCGTNGKCIDGDCVETAAG